MTDTIEIHRVGRWTYQLIRRPTTPGQEWLAVQLGGRTLGLQRARRRAARLLRTTRVEVVDVIADHLGVDTEEAG